MSPSEMTQAVKLAERIAKDKYSAHSDDAHCLAVALLDTRAKAAEAAKLLEQSAAPFDAGCVTVRELAGIPAQAPPRPEQPDPEQAAAIKQRVAEILRDGTPDIEDWKAASRRAGEEAAAARDRWLGRILGKAMGVRI